MLDVATQLFMEHILQPFTHSILDPRLTLALNLISGVIVVTKFIPSLRVFGIIVQGGVLVIELVRELLGLNKKGDKYQGYTNLAKEEING